MDQLLFYFLRNILLYRLGDASIFLSAIVARTISSFINYLLNKDIVFKNNNGKNTLLKYYALVIIQLAVSSLSVFLIYKTTNINTSVIKVIIDILIFIVNYFVQKKIIFFKQIVVLIIERPHKQ